MGVKIMAMTYTEVISSISLLIITLGIYVKLKVDLATLETRVKELEKKQEKDDIKFDNIINKIDELKDLIIQKL